MFWNKEEKTVIDLDQLREQLIIDEGQVNEIYHDHLGYATFGIGHLVLEGDPEHGFFEIYDTRMIQAMYTTDDISIP